MVGQSPFSSKFAYLFEQLKNVMIFSRVANSLVDSFELMRQEIRVQGSVYTSSRQLFTGLPNPVGIWVLFRGFFFSVSGKVLPLTPLLSGVFVHRVFCAYFVRFEGAGVMRRFPWCTQENILKLLNLQCRRKSL